MRQSDTLRRELVLANHILAHEDVLDVFGHVSVRDPAQPNEYLLSRSRSPEAVELDDILRFTLDSRPVDPNGPPSYSERVIHGALYDRRPDIGAVCHFHAAAVMPFCVTDVPLVPVFHVGATMGAKVNLWSGRAEFGETNMLVATDEEGASLAEAMGPDWAVLMHNHGAVVAGRTLREAVFRSVHLCRNAAIQFASMQIGEVRALTPREIELAGEFNLREPVLDRAWDYWKTRESGEKSK